MDMWIPIRLIRGALAILNYIKAGSNRVVWVG